MSTKRKIFFLGKEVLFDSTRKPKFEHAFLSADQSNHEALMFRITYFILSI